VGQCLACLVGPLSMRNVLCVLSLSLWACGPLRGAAARCTYKAHGTTFITQSYRSCLTCGMGSGEGCCLPCLEECHAGHTYGELRTGSFYCNCGHQGRCEKLARARAEASGELSSDPSTFRGARLVVHLAFVALGLLTTGAYHGANPTVTAKCVRLVLATGVVGHILSQVSWMGVWLLVLLRPRVVKEVRGWGWWGGAPGAPPSYPVLHVVQDAMLCVRAGCCVVGRAERCVWCGYQWGGCRF
jgi:hypothetical protein